MEFQCDNINVELLYLLLLLFWFIYLYFVKHYGYWEQRDIPHVPAVFPLGSLSEALVFSNVNLAIAYDNIYKEFRGERFCGIIEVRTPCLVIRDPSLIRRILTTDFNHFTDRTMFENNPKEYMMQNLFTMSGGRWKERREKLTSAYDRANMKMIYCLLEKCSILLKDYVDQMLEKSDLVDVKDVLSRFTIDTVTKCIFGADMTSSSDVKSKFYQILPMVFHWDFVLLRNLFIYNAFPIFRKVYFRHIDLIKPQIKEFLTNFIRVIVNHREKHNLERLDFLDLLIKIRQNKSIFDDDGINGNFSKRPGKKEALSVEDIAGEILAFLAGGYEKASSAITFCLYELSRSAHIQNKLYREVRHVLNRHKGAMSFQALQEMTYMDQVINETLRLYPPLPILHRSCSNDYKVPNSDLVIERDVRVVIPIYSLHHDPEHFPQPGRFNPQRFNKVNIANRNPYVFLPFGEGSRKCIGLHFGMMQIKSGLATLINNFEVSLTPDTKIPIEIKSKTFVIQPEKPLMLILKKRKSQ